MSYYLVFAYDRYYPGGGMGDLRYAGPSQERAIDVADAEWDRNDWIELVEVTPEGYVEWVKDMRGMPWQRPDEVTLEYTS